MEIIPDKRIRDIDTGLCGGVLDILSTQFTVELDDGELKFFFYKDHKLTWEFEDE